MTTSNPTNKDTIDEILTKTIFDTGAKLTEIGWEKWGENLAEAREQIQKLLVKTEERAARKIQAVINAHRGLNTDTELLSLVGSSLPVLNLLEAEAQLQTNTKTEEE